MINASCEGICVEFERKTTQHWFFYFQIARKYKQIFYDWYILHFIYDNFGIWLL